MRDRATLCSVKEGYLVVRGGTVEAVCSGEEFAAMKASGAKEFTGHETIHDYGNQLIIPGMTDLHLHASQFPFRGLGMDMELLEWLNQHAFPEEMKYADPAYAEAAYKTFVEALLKSPTTRACLFATIHKDSAVMLAEFLEDAGFSAYVGKVNMDREAPDRLRETAEQSLEDTREFVETVRDRCRNCKPILTPRFVPSCSDSLMRGLGKLREEYDLPVQSHLSENLSEVEIVKRLNRKAEFYGDAYDMFGLFGGGFPVVMAHCVYSPDAEIERMKKNGVYVAHCANSNFSLASGIAPVRKYLEYGLNIGLGTDVAGGFSLSMFRAIQDTVAVSRLYWRLRDTGAQPVSFREAFYLATMGGGSFFGKVGSFLPGYEADILVLDEAKEPNPREPDLERRLVQFCYQAGEDAVSAKYIKGRQVY